MNLQINFIRPSEQRSASMVSLKFLGTIAAVAVPTAMLLWIGWTYMGYLEARSRLAGLEEEQAQSKHQQQEAQSLKKKYDRQRALNDELMGWSRSRVPWNEVLDGMWAGVPDTMQWRSLKMDAKISWPKDGELVREHVFVLSGRCQGPNAEGQVSDLWRSWVSNAPMSNWIQEAKVTSFTDDKTPGAAKEDRLFQIDASCYPGRFHAPAGK